jgi:hypothetical protein
MKSHLYTKLRKPISCLIKSTTGLQVRFKYIGIVVLKYANRVVTLHAALSGTGVLVGQPF